MPTICAFEQAHLVGVLQLCADEGWASFPDDPDMALRVLTAPGVTTVVALDGAEVVGFAELISDGEFQSYLANLVVARAMRRTGLGRTLIEDVLVRAGGARVDLLSEDGAVSFYESFDHKVRPGFRIYPESRASGAP